MRLGARWHVKGVGADAQQAAQDAARQAGMPVGEWLESLIRDRAPDPAVTAAARSNYASRTPIAAQASGATEEISDAIARLNARVDRLLGERKGPSVDAALGTLSRERARATTGDWAAFDQAAAEIAMRQVELDGGEPSSGAFNPQPPPYGAGRAGANAQAFDQVPSGIHDAVLSLRKEISEIHRTLSEASPRHAIQALEGEVRSLATRLDSRRSSEGDAALSNLERGLAEVRDQLHALTPAENLSGFAEAINALGRKVDLIAAGGHDPAALEQLEAAIVGLRGIISHVASADALATLSAEVRALAEKIEHGLIGGVGSGRGADILETLDQRISAIADALQNTSFGGHSGSPDLEATIRALSDKVEQLQASRTEVVLGHLEDRIARLVDKLDASESRLGNIDTIERAIVELLQHVEDLRTQPGAQPATAPPAVFDMGHDADLLERDVRRAQDSLEAMHGTIGDVVDRLAMIETGMRDPIPGEAQPPAFAPRPEEPPQAAWHDVPDHEEQPAFEQHELPPPPFQDHSEPADTIPHADAPPIEPPMPPDEPLPAPSGARPPAAAPRPPLDASLPPNHPLEPGSRQPAPTRAAIAPEPPVVAPPPVPPPAPIAPITPAPVSTAASPADRIAASQAALEPARADTPDSGSKSSFIIAARRAAQAAAAEKPVPPARATVVGSAVTGAAAAAGAGHGFGRHIKSILVGLSVVVILAGALHLAVSLFDGREPAPEQPKPQSNALPAPNQFAANQAATIVAPTAPAASSLPLPQLPSSPASPWGAPPAPLAAPDRAPAAASPSGSPAELTATVVQRKMPPPPTPVAAPPATIPAAPVAAPTPAPAPAPVAALPVAPPRPVALPASNLPTTIGGRALLAAADAGDPAAAYEVAMRFSEGRGVPTNPEQAAVWFERAAKAGLAPAQFRLGGAYEKGIGVTKNLQRAHDLYVAAAEKGNAKAMHNLAVLHAEGFDGKPDYATAVQWFRRAASYGIADSQYNLGVLYARGIGIEQNLAESFKWFALAAQQGDRDAAQKRDDVAKRLDPQTLNAVRLAVQNWVSDLQPDEATMVKSPAGGWDEPSKPGPSKAKPKSRANRAAASAPL